VKRRSFITLLGVGRLGRSWRAVRAQQRCSSI